MTSSAWFILALTVLFRQHTLRAPMVSEVRRLVRRRLHSRMHASRDHHLLAPCGPRRQCDRHSPYLSKPFHRPVCPARCPPGRRLIWGTVPAARPYAAVKESSAPSRSVPMPFARLACWSALWAGVEDVFVVCVPTIMAARSFPQLRRHRLTGPPHYISNSTRFRYRSSKPSVMHSLSTSVPLWINRPS